MELTIGSKPCYYAYPGMKGTVISRVRSEENKKQMVDKVMQIVAQHFGITPLDIISHCRKRDRVEARMIFCYMCNQFIPISKSRIAELLDRDHTSVLHSLKTIQDLMETDERFRKEVNFVASKFFN